MTWRIRKSFSFDAAHQLGGLPNGHKCARLHGHTYQVEIILAADDLDGCGFVHDFADLAPAKAYIDTTLDHRCLNDVIDQPTSEHLAAHLYAWCGAHLKLRPDVRVDCIRVSETPGTWAEYRERSETAEVLSEFAQMLIAEGRGRVAGSVNLGATRRLRQEPPR